MNIAFWCKVCICLTCFLCNCR
uniref:Uncharacterized protein n=1 Tax=Arundo donax TaxID=35708 RepID=A0A0A9G3V4_ARUDO